MILDDYRDLLCDNRPLMDVRAPVEFTRGALPGAVNLPLLDDAEREAVGIEYKKRGNAAAVALGERLISGDHRQRRLAQWAEFARNHPRGALYCFRGGQRSAIVQQWLAESGVEYPRVSGGYKAMRQFLISSLERLCAEQDLVVVGGRAGSGKTRLLNQRIAPSLDLEGFAHHRGSAFGRRPGGQPPPPNFENRLVIRWLQLEAAGARAVATEDESRTIGRLAIPEPLWQRLNRAPIALVKVRLAKRVDQILGDYVIDHLAEFERSGVADPFQQFSNELLESLGRIQRRVGGLRYRALQSIMLEALELHRDEGDIDGHRHWIAPLLRDYYDPMYDYQLEKKRDRVILEGSPGAVVRYLDERLNA